MHISLNATRSRGRFGRETQLRTVEVAERQQVLSSGECGGRGRPPAVFSCGDGKCECQSHVLVVSNCVRTFIEVCWAVGGGWKAFFGVCQNYFFAVAFGMPAILRFYSVLVAKCIAVGRLLSTLWYNFLL